MQTIHDIIEEAWCSSWPRRPRPGNHSDADAADGLVIAAYRAVQAFIQIMQAVEAGDKS